MKVRSAFLQRLHLDRVHYLLTGRMVQLVKEFFTYLDCRYKNALDDIQFVCFMQSSTDLSEEHILRIFDTLDIDHSGSIEFDEFYLLVCMLVAVKDGLAKQFLWRHSRTCFELLDQDGSRCISYHEFETFGYIFNIESEASRSIFQEFDIDGSQALDYDEFRVFSLACLDENDGLDKKNAEILQEKRLKEKKKLRAKAGPCSTCSLQ